MIPAVRPATTSLGKSRRGLYFFSADRMGKLDTRACWKENLAVCFAIASFTFVSTGLLSSGCLYWDSNSDALTGVRSLTPSASILPVLVSANSFRETGKSGSLSGSSASGPVTRTRALFMVLASFRGRFRYYIHIGHPATSTGAGRVEHWLRPAVILFKAKETTPVLRH